MPSLRQQKLRLKRRQRRELAMAVAERLTPTPKETIGFSKINAAILVGNVIGAISRQSVIAMDGLITTYESHVKPSSPK